jgi:hypothetical protein
MFMIRALLGKGYYMGQSAIRLTVAQALMRLVPIARWKADLSKLSGTRLSDKVALTPAVAQ